MLTEVRFVERDLTVQEQMWLANWIQKTDMFSLERLVMSRQCQPPTLSSAQFRAVTMSELFTMIIPPLQKNISESWKRIRQQLETLDGTPATGSKPS